MEQRGSGNAELRYGCPKLAGNPSSSLYQPGDDQIARVSISLAPYIFRLPIENYFNEQIILFVRLLQYCTRYCTQLCF